jgi:hypothetical protein
MREVTEKHSTVEQKGRSHGLVMSSEWSSDSSEPTSSSSIRWAQTLVGTGSPTLGVDQWPTVASLGKGQDIQQHLRKEDGDHSRSSNLKDMIEVVEAQHGLHMAEYDSCGLQNMISADAEMRTVLTALAGKMRSCKKKHVAPEGDEAEIGKGPCQSVPLWAVGGHVLRICAGTLVR